ncbi:M20/M25/M40 family metallo-hydrolase [Candidatus Bipolaricaulota bacterium]
MKRSNVDHEGLTLFEELLGIPAPSGFERPMAEFLVEKLKGWGFEPSLDDAGNVSVLLEGKGDDAPLVCLAAHIDEIGMVVTQIGADGSLRVTRSGGLHPWKLGEGPVEILGDCETIVGAVSMGSGHSRSVVAQDVTWERVRVLTGLTPEVLAERGVRIGTPIVPARAVRGPFVFGASDDPMVGAWSFDNRLGVAVLLQLLKRATDEGFRPHCRFLVAFTVDEEIGCHGAKILAQRERPDVFVAVDGSPLVPECPIALDGRPGIRSKDRVATYDQELLADLCHLSAEAGVELQPVVYDGAASDASLVYSIGASPRAACVGYVRESSHGFEVAPLSTFDKLLTTITTFFERWEG